MVHPGCDESSSKQVPVAEVRPDSWVKPKRAPEPIKDDTVTLPLSQFKQILQAIGQVNNVNGNEKLFDCQENQEFHSSKDQSENRANHSEGPKHVQHCETFDNVSKSTGEISSKLSMPCPLDVVISCPSSLENSWSDPQVELSPTKLSPLSKVEQKRLQWKREKAEMLDWNPWGRPGAGAPPKKTQIVAPITPRTNNQLLMVQTSAAMPFNSNATTGISSCITSPSHSRLLTSNIEQQHFSPSKNFMNYTCVAQPIKPVPPMFRSSIAFGNADNESISSDFYKRQQWLHELDCQREEQRRMQEQMHMAHVPDSNWGNNCKDDVESLSVSIDSSILPGAVDYHKRNYVRGQGFQLDPAAAALAEERRQKAQEYQQAIRLQMEEKQKRVQAEQERKKLEEEAEERRLQAERARIQEEYEKEQLRLKQKAEMEEKKQQAVEFALQKAAAEAEMEKKNKKIQKLIPPQAETETHQSPTKKTEGLNSSTLPLCIEEKLKIEDSEGSQAIVEKESILNVESPCASELGSKKDLGIQTVVMADVEKNSTYVVDRVLTPSIFRVRAKTGGRGREFGTQTDIHYGKYSNEDGESTESNTSSYNPISKHIVRVQHTKPYKAQRRVQCNDMLSVERPKWGVNQPSKSYVRMTERDPHFVKRKKMQELRKQHWARELAAQKSSQLSRRPTVASYPSLRARKAISSSDYTVGYSSSEFETSKSCHHLRSNSTPRYQKPSGFQSDCGSAETVAYLNYDPSVQYNRLSRTVLRRRVSESSDNLPSIIGGSEPSPAHRLERLHSVSYSENILPPMRRKWHSQETFYPVSNFHSFSPPHVPGVHPRVLGDNFRYELPPPHVPQRRKWSDQESFDLESVVRSRVAEESRESSVESSEKSHSVTPSSAGSSREKSASSQNPLVCPEVVTGRPTPRQDRILQNLSSLRQGLLKKQKELESLIRRPPPFFS